MSLGKQPEPISSHARNSNVVSIVTIENQQSPSDIWDQQGSVIGKENFSPNDDGKLTNEP